jgi:hypothetical protein
MLVLYLFFAHESLPALQRLQGHSGAASPAVPQQPQQQQRDVRDLLAFWVAAGCLMAGMGVVEGALPFRHVLRAAALVGLWCGRQWLVLPPARAACPAVAASAGDNKKAA